MRRWLMDIALAVILAWAVCILASVMVSDRPRQIGIRQTSVAQTVIHDVETIGVLRGSTVEFMTLERYLTGVLLCEIPANFHDSAKQAQAIVARTYALRTAQRGIKHGSNIICDDPGCCQGYISDVEYEEKWGVKEPVLQAAAAVEVTDGLVITYEGALIDATYFACSGGMTEDALAVWGADVPYLRAVESPGEEQCSYYVETVQFTPEEFCHRLGMELTGRPAGWIRDVAYTAGGGVAQLTVGEQTFSGTQLRSLLGLRSTRLYITSTADSILVTTKGFGHRVGMSQYGADAMAEAGKSFDEIIKHYYAGVELECMD